MEPTNTPTVSTSHNLTELQFKALVNHSHEGIIVVRPDGILVFASPAIERLFGYRVEELLGKDPIFITHPQDAAELVALLGHLLAEPNATQTHQYRVFDKAGNIHWVESVITNCVDVEGVEGLVFNYRDITDEVVADEKIAALRQRRDNLINSVPELIWSVDENLRLLDGNTAFFAKYNSTSGHILKPGDHVIDLEHFDDYTRALWRKRYDTALQGQPYFEEHNTKGPLGWIEITLNPILNADNKVTGVVAYVKGINERKQIEEELKTFNRNRDALVNAIPDVIWSIDNNFKLVDANKAFYDYVYQITGIHIKPGDDINLKHKAEDTISLWSGYYQHALNGNMFVEHSRFDHPTPGWHEVTLNPIVDGNNVVGVACYAKDITARKKSEELQMAERLKRDALINNIPDLMWSIDAEYRLIDANKAFYKSMQQWIGMPVYPGLAFNDTPVDKPTQEYIIGLLNRALNGETFIKNLYFDYQNIGWVEVTVSPIYDGTTIVGVACNSKDINKRKADEEQLVRSELSMAHAQQMAGIGSWDIELVDGNPFVVTPVWSDETFRILGYDKEKDTPSLEAFINRIHPDDRTYVTNAISLGITNNDNTPIVYRVQWPDGTIRWIESEGVVEHDAQGNPTRIRGTHHDITEARQLEKEREKITTDLMQRNNELEQFAYIVSHNLRGPVANIMGLSNELENMPPTDDMYNIFMGELKNSVNKLDEVIKDMSYILRLKREVAEQREVVVFSKLVEDIKGSINNMLREHNVTITTNLTDTPPIHTLKTYLYSVFYNLITNSIKYRQTGIAPVIHIAGTVDGEYTILQFTDNGIGIDLEKYGTTVFGLYKRFHTHIEGKGMGLYMVKSQVESLGGSVSIHSKVNQGTTFTIRLKN